MEPPTDDLLGFITSQEHSEDQLDQVLQSYQAYQETQSETETPTRQINAHITYHVAQANQAKHGSLVKRIFGYPEGAIRFRTGEPDFSDKNLTGQELSRGRAKRRSSHIKREETCQII